MNSSKSAVFNPGPGSYNIPSSLKVQHGLSKQSNQKRFKPYTTNVPGPGQYNKQPQNNGPNALMLSRTKEHKNDEIPGPGSYQPDFNKVMKSQSGYLLPKCERTTFQTKKQQKLPGPGTYDTKSTLLHENAIGFGPQRKIKLADEKNVPGPGQYNTLESRITQQNAPKHQFSKAQRSQSYNSVAPGPGAYKTLGTFNTENKKGFSISFKGNNIFQTRQKRPGPGAYNYQEIDKLKYKSSSFSMPKQLRLKMQNQKQIKLNPGPQKYNVNKSSFDHKSFTVGKQFRKSLVQKGQIPGPGSYNIKLLSNEMPHFSIPKSHVSWIKANSNPGPANYDPKMIYNTQYQSIGVNKDDRKEIYDSHKKFIPGPGQYTINQLINKKAGYTVGNSKREDLGSSRDKMPGPADYHLLSTLKGAKP